MLVEVTQENINQGVVDSCNSCPIALAMQDKSFENVKVGTQYIFCNYQPTPFQSHVAVIKNDTRVIRWINDFDGGKEVFPIKININEERRNATLVE